MKIRELSTQEQVDPKTISSRKLQLVEDGADVSVYLTFVHSFNPFQFNPPQLIRFATDVTTIRSDEQYRSLAAGVGWAIGAGILTGGIGSLVGAAWGGRRRGETFFAINFEGGISALVSTGSKYDINRLNHAESGRISRKLPYWYSMKNEDRYMQLATNDKVAAIGFERSLRPNTDEPTVRPLTAGLFQGKPERLARNMTYATGSAVGPKNVDDRIKSYKGYVIVKAEQGVSVDGETFANVFEAEKWINANPHKFPDK